MKTKLMLLPLLHANGGNGDLLQPVSCEYVAISLIIGTQP